MAWIEQRRRESYEAGQLAHGEPEERLEVKSRELFRQMFQDHLDLRAQQELRLEAVVAADGVARRGVEADHERGLLTVFGKVEVTRVAYRRRGHAKLHPTDAELNLPLELHSHGLRRLAVVEGTRGSFDNVREAILRSPGQRLGKRQLEELVQRAATDFDAFYKERKRAAGEPADVLVISCDRKGVVMRPDALRAATAQAAARSTTKLTTRLSKGEKRNRKRMAEIGAVNDAEPVPRNPRRHPGRLSPPGAAHRPAGPTRPQQVADRQRGGARRGRGEQGLRRGRAPPAPPYLGRARRRQQPPG
ncbi:MAG TPA: hypothetical protein VKI99_03585 [Candidatus Dormibacteraeota bacterium]|nr:hypothetical protein [Candidatus Dormibacteraeota bacterium]